jgi:hypothetical protein
MVKPPVTDFKKISIQYSGLPCSFEILYFMVLTLSWLKNKHYVSGTHTHTHIYKFNNAIIFKAVHKASASYLCPSTTNNEIKTEI